LLSVSAKRSSSVAGELDCALVGLAAGVALLSGVALAMRVAAGLKVGMTMLPGSLVGGSVGGSAFSGWQGNFWRAGGCALWRECCALLVARAAGDHDGHEQGYGDADVQVTV